MSPTTRILCLLLIGGTLLGHSACSTTRTASETTLTPVSDSKADNYYSNVAKEFIVSGSFTLTVEPQYLDDEQQKTERLQELVARKQTAVGMYLTAFVTRKLEELFTNSEYGGFGSMVRTLTFQASDVKELDGGVFEIPFRANVAGPRDLMAKIPNARETENGITFELEMKKLSNSDLYDLQRKVIIRNFDPDDYQPEQLEVLTLTMVPDSESSDAYPDFASFFADGVFDITLFQGYDYNESRSDLQDSRQFYQQLLRLGFTAPVASFDELGLDSGPFTKTVKAAGKEVEIRVYIFHADMDTDRGKYRQKLIDELAVRDVVFYNGHAGPYFGFYLDEAQLYTIDYKEIASLALSEKKQLFIANGCQTYSQYADMFYQNPAKDTTNLDVFTTVNFSYGEGSDAILDWLVKTDADGNHVPSSYYGIVKALNALWLNDWKEVYYGVHGIDDNSRRHPFANLERLGQSCESTSDCGDSQGNRCIDGPDGGAKICATICLDDSGCPEADR
ncbi:MAG: hypothetical protein KC609_13990, partial [Myxococcales bacterium]|nr:hypothetical protein [Myxococcales bacterium]